jgi:putative DNA primase/helicase
MLVKGEFHLDGANKDSVLTAISHWIVEIGELDSSFKKDIARLKGFLTADRDKIRVPYGRTAGEYPRRTVFAATVNDSNFLVDNTGNSRWWTIPVKEINYKHGIDMQQVFAQLAVDLDKGAQWWLTPEEELELEKSNANYKAISVIQELVVTALDASRIGEQNLPLMSAIELLRHLGIEHPKNTDCKECAAVLRDILGDHKRINGINKWRIPLVKKQQFHAFHNPNDY